MFCHLTIEKNYLNTIRRERCIRKRNSCSGDLLKTKLSSPSVFPVVMLLMTGRYLFLGGGVNRSLLLLDVVRLLGGYFEMRSLLFGHIQLMMLFAWWHVVFARVARSLKAVAVPLACRTQLSQWCIILNAVGRGCDQNQKCRKKCCFHFRKM